ncbi:MULTISPECIES: DnaA N-terminal domain-containing protein [unclassified Tardiphaga]|uniref:DnaA N-terminal domain-containing protein n=1 Tax=unclassified Tardiphaga TaxID=2631404 RepID=UPI00143CC184|nr:MULTISPECIES: DnaA N-terminal domain-containing protein [unclassified Tardiphaga]
MTAEIILIPKHLRMDWMDVMALDATLSPMAFKVAGVIGTHFGNKSGLAFISQEMIARVCEIDPSTTKRMVGELERRGYILVKRREIGFRADGRKVYGGKGTANEYVPACDATQLSATDRGQRLIAAVGKTWEAKAPKPALNGCAEGDPKQGTDDLLNGSKQGMGELLSEHQSRSFGRPKQGMGDLPTLEPSSKVNSTGERGIDHRAVAGPLGAAGDALRKRLGDDRFRAWFGDKVAIYSEDGDTVTLAAPTRFIRDYIIAQFLDTVLDVWRRIRPATKRIDVIVAAERKVG